MLFRQFCLFFKLKRSYVTDLYMKNLVSFLSRHHTRRTYPAWLASSPTPLFHQFANVPRQLPHALFAGVPGTHETCTADADEGVEHPSSATQGFQHHGWQFHEDAVGLYRKHQLDFRNIVDQLCQQPSAAVGVGGVFQPGAGFQQPDPGCRKETHLGCELSGLLAAILEIFGKRPVEEQDRFTHCHAVLGAAETEHIHAGFPAQFRR